MPLAIDEAAVRIRGIQKALAITHIVEFDDEDVPVQVPFVLAVKRAHPYFMAASKVPTEFPCFINKWEASEITYRSALAMGNFTDHMQMLIKDADTDRAAAIASAFFTKIVEGFAANIKLGGWGPATVLGLRGSATLAICEYGFPGLDLFLDIHLNTVLTMSP